MNSHVRKLKSIRKWMILAFVSVVIIPMFLMVQQTDAAREEPIKVYIDSKELSLDVDPVLQDGTTLVPFRALFEALGLDVQWNGETQEVIGSKDELSIQLTIGHNEATVNGETVTLLQAPQIMGGSTMVPLRFVGESTGAFVAWNPYAPEAPEIIVATEQYWTEELGITRERLEEIINEAIEVAKKEYELQQKIDEQLAEQEESEPIWDGEESDKDFDNLCPAWRYNPLTNSGELYMTPC